MSKSSGVAAIDMVTASVEQTGEMLIDDAIRKAGGEQHEGELAALADDKSRSAARRYQFMPHQRPSP